MKKYFAVFTVSVTALGGCIKNPDCNNGSTSSFVFDMPYTISPVTDTFAVGDTMWIEHQFANPILNKEDGKSYMLNSNFDFRNRIVIEDLKTDPIMPTNDYDIVLEDGSIDPQRGSIGYALKYDYVNNTFRLKRGVVWKRSGWFVFTLHSRISSNSLRESGQKITRCRDEFMQLNIPRSNGGKNAYLMQEAADEDYRNISEEQMMSWIAFYVKE